MHFLAPMMSPADRLKIKQPLIDSFATKKGKPNQTHMATLLHLSGAPAAIQKRNTFTIRSVDTHFQTLTSNSDLKA